MVCTSASPYDEPSLRTPSGRAVTEETYPPSSSPPQPDPTYSYTPDGTGGMGLETCAYWGEIGCNDDPDITVPPPKIGPWD